MGWQSGESRKVERAKLIKHCLMFDVMRLSLCCPVLWGFGFLGAAFIMDQAKPLGNLSCVEKLLLSSASPTRIFEPMFHFSFYIAIWS